MASQSRHSKTTMSFADKSELKAAVRQMLESVIGIDQREPPGEIEEGRDLYA